MKCIRPTRAVWYPAARSRCAKVGTEAPKSSPLSKQPSSEGSTPVIIEARDGEHSGVVHRARSKTAPSSARESIHGERAAAST